jgi:hypothetical protein
MQGDCFGRFGNLNAAPRKGQVAALFEQNGFPLAVPGAGNKLQEDSRDFSALKSMNPSRMTR